MITRQQSGSATQTSSTVRTIAGDDVCGEPPRLGYDKWWSRCYERRQRALIDLLDLEPVQRAELKDRWLDEIARLEQSAQWCRSWHNRLQIFAIVGGATVSFLVAVGGLVGTTKIFDVGAGGVSQAMAFTVSLIVSAALGIDGFLRLSQRYRETRPVVEELRIAGSKFFSMSPDVYRVFVDHRKAFPTFMERVENILANDARAWAALGTESEKENGGTEKHPPDGGKPAADGTEGDVAKKNA